jgi:iron complex transport system substrate-binding protein
MRLFSHTCSNTEIVCALGCAGLLVGIDTDSDHPPEVVTPLPKLGRDLDLDLAGVIALKPDLVLTSLTVPGHERIVEGLQHAGLRTLVCDPQGLEDIYGDIRRIAAALEVAPRGEALVASMRAAMPPVLRTRPPRLLIEWWPKPVIAPAMRSWASDLIVLAGGVNPWGELDAKSTTLSDAQILEAAPDAVVMSWCGVKRENYRADIVRRRPGWDDVPALRHNRIVPITEAFLGRPGPRLVEGYRALRAVVESIPDA